LAVFHAHRPPAAGALHARFIIPSGAFKATDSQGIRLSAWRNCFDHEFVGHSCFLPKSMKSIIQMISHLALGMLSAGVCLADAGIIARATNSPTTLSISLVDGLSLEESILLALNYNPDLRASSARIEASSARARQSARWSNPELELSAEDWPVSGGHGFNDAKQLIGISQVLPYPGKKSLDKRIGRAGVKLSEAELDLRRTELVRDVKAGFFRVLTSEQLVEVASQLVSVAESSAATARKRVDAGAAAYQEQLRAEVQWEQARTELSGFQRELGSARQVFVTLLGRPDLKDVNLSGSLAVTPDAGLLEDKGAEWMTQHPSAAAAQVNVDRAQLEYRRARLEPYPDMKVGVAGGRIGETDESIVQLGFSVPLPLLDRGKGKQQESRANLNAAEAELFSVRLQLQREWAHAQKRCRTAAEQVANYRERILPKANEALRLVQTGFEQGKFGFIDLVDTQRTTAEVRLAYQHILLEFNIAQAELAALLQPQTSQP
jgi:outer membrane protein, heavy metal efflux system